MQTERVPKFRKPNPSRASVRPKQNASFSAAVTQIVERRNRRSVWSLGTHAYPCAHFATFPPALVEPCVLITTRPGDTVLDPFGGSGTTGQVALSHGRNAILIDLNPANRELINRRVEALAQS